MNNTRTPHSEKWLYKGKNLSKLDKAIDWAEKTPPKDNFDTFVKGLDEESDKDKIDMNNPDFQMDLFSLEKIEQTALIKTLKNKPAYMGSAIFG